MAMKPAEGNNKAVSFSSHTKVKFERLSEKQTLKTKDRFELNRFRYGLQGSLGYAGISVYYYYALNDLFEKGLGPDATETFQTQVGLAISIF